MLNALIGWFNPQPAKNINAKEKVLDLILNEPISITGLQINTDAANTLKTELVQAADSNRQKIINTLLEFIAPKDGNDREFDNQRVLKFMMLFALDQNMSNELLDEDYKNIIKYAALCGNFEAIRIMSQLNFLDTPNGFARVINNIELLKKFAEESHEHAVYTMLRGGALLPTISQSQGMTCTEKLKERLMYFYKEAWLCSKSFEDKDAPFNKDDMHTVFQIYYFSTQIAESIFHSFIGMSYYSDLTKDDKEVCNLLQNGHHGYYYYQTKFTMGNIYDPKVIIKKQAALKQKIEKYEAIRKELDEAEQATGWIAAAKRQAIIAKHAIIYGVISAYTAGKQKNIFVNLHNTLKGFTFAGAKEVDGMTQFVIQKSWNAELDAMHKGMDLVAQVQHATPAQEEVDTPDDLFRSINTAGNEEDFSSDSDDEYKDSDDEYKDLDDNEEYEVSTSEEESEVSAQASVSSSDERKIEYSYSEEHADQVEQENLRAAEQADAVAQPVSSEHGGNALAASEEESVSDDEYEVSASEEEHSADQVNPQPTPEAQPWHAEDKEDVHKNQALAASEEESVSDDEYEVSTSEEEHSADQVEQEQEQEQEQEHVQTPEEVAAPAVELPGNILSRHPLATGFPPLALCAAAGIAFASHKMGEGSMKVGLSALGNVVTNWFKNNLPAAFRR